MVDVDVSALLTEAVRSATLPAVATIAPHWISRVVETSRDVTLPATPTGGGPEKLGDRLDEGRPLTPLAEPVVESALGDYGARPASVGDLLAAHDVGGERVAGELERQCALEAARLAPPLARLLVEQHPDLPARMAERYPMPAADKDSLDPVMALCGELAALLALEMVASVTARLADVPLSPNAPASR